MSIHLLFPYQLYNEITTNLSDYLFSKINWLALKFEIRFGNYWSWSWELGHPKNWSFKFSQKRFEIDAHPLL